MTGLGIQVFLMAFGALLTLIGVLVFFLLAWFKETTGQHDVVKILQAEFRLTNPALVIFIGGLGLMIAPLFFREPGAAGPTPLPTAQPAPPTVAAATPAPTIAVVPPPTTLITTNVNAVPGPTPTPPSPTPPPTPTLSPIPTSTATLAPTATPTLLPTATPTRPPPTPTLPLSYDLAVSASPDRSHPVSLKGRVAFGEIYIFVSPAQGVERVRFFLDNSLVNDEVGAPFDFLGTRPDGTAAHLNSRQLANGDHTIRAEIVKTNNSLVAFSSTFKVANYDLLVSTVPDRSIPASLGGKTVSGDIYVFTSPGQGAERVRFFLNDALFKEEVGAPFDLMGTNPDGSATPFNTGQLVNGSHNIRAEIVLTGASVSMVVNANFTVAN